MRQPDVSKESSIASAVAAMRANRPLRAEKICRDYLAANPGCPEHLRLLGHALIKQKRLDEALSQIRFARWQYSPVHPC